MCWAATELLHKGCTLLNINVLQNERIYMFIRCPVISSAQALWCWKTHFKAKLKAEILLYRKGSQQFFLMSTYAVIVLDKMTFFSKLISNTMNHTAFLVFLGSWCFKHLFKISEHLSTWNSHILVKFCSAIILSSGE